MTTTLVINDSARQLSITGGALGASLAFNLTSSDSVALFINASGATVIVSNLTISIQRTSSVHLAASPVISVINSSVDLNNISIVVNQILVASPSGIQPPIELAVGYFFFGPALNQTEYGSFADHDTARHILRHVVLRVNLVDLSDSFYYGIEIMLLVAVEQRYFSMSQCSIAFVPSRVGFNGIVELRNSNESNIASNEFFNASLVVTVPAFGGRYFQNRVSRPTHPDGGVIVRRGKNQPDERYLPLLSVSELWIENSVRGVQIGFTGFKFEHVKCAYIAHCVVAVDDIATIPINIGDAASCVHIFRRSLFHSSTSAGD